MLTTSKKWSIRRILTAPILAMLMLTSLSCNHKKTNQRYVIGFSQCVGSDMWRKTMLNEMKMELSLHPGVTFIYTNAEGNSTVQIQQVQQMIDQQIDLLVISPNEARPLTPVVEEAFSRGIPVIVIDRKTHSNLYTAYVGADNYEIGKMAGEYLGSMESGPVNVLEVMGLSGSSPAIERQRGFHDGISKFRNVRITKQIYGNWLKDHAREELLKSEDGLNNIDAVFAHNDQTALGTRQVFEKFCPGKQVKIIGVDALPGDGGGLQMVADKTLNASLLYPTGGKEAIRSAIAILNKEPFVKENILQTVVIDSSNVQLMKMQWDKVSSQQNDIERQHDLLKEQEKIYNDQRLVLNILVITLVLSVFFGGLALHALRENLKINKTLELKNHEILTQRNQLIEMSGIAEAATEAKLNFFTHISHEFKTPLTLILSPLEDLMNIDKKLSVVESRNVKLIHKNVLRLLLLVNQLIDYRRIEYDKMTIKASENDIVSFIKDIMESFNDIARRRNIDFRLSSEEKYLPTWFDVNMLDKVIFNLLSNAFKFTNINGKIHIGIKRSPDNKRVLISVTDNGTGITEESLMHVFDLFYQDRQSGMQGSGLGLSLSKELMTLHHGSISAESKKWMGTTFQLSLPLGHEHLKEEEKVGERLVKDDLYEDARFYLNDLEKMPALKRMDWFQEIKEQSILIIEDNEDMVAYLTQKFEEHYEVFTANNGLAGLNEAYDRVPDLIISDVVLPELSGRELSHKLKADFRTSHIPIILLTAQGNIDQQIEGMKNQADLYMVKPFNFALLLENVRTLIKNRLLLKEHYISEFPVTGKLPVPNKLDKKFLNDLAGIVESNLSNEKFSVDEISKKIGISRVQLYRKVKALLDCNVTDYIMNRRLQKAKYLLTHEDLTISEITYTVGFSSATYFSTVFKSKYLTTPSEFKKKTKNTNAT